MIYVKGSVREQIPNESKGNGNFSTFTLSLSLALCLSMAYLSLSRIDDYWSSRNIYHRFVSIVWFSSPLWGTSSRPLVKGQINKARN